MYIEPKYITTIKNKFQKYLPGYIARINIASLKIGNDLLGHEEGDKDIEDLENIIMKCLDKPKLYQRIAGDIWILFFSQNPVKSINLSAFIL